MQSTSLDLQEKIRRAAPTKYWNECVRLTCGNRGSENIVIEAVVILELTFRYVERHAFSADLAWP